MAVTTMTHTLHRSRQNASRRDSNGWGKDEKEKENSTEIQFDATNNNNFISEYVCVDLLIFSSTSLRQWKKCEKYFWMEIALMCLLLAKINKQNCNDECVHCIHR